MTAFDRLRDGGFAIGTMIMTDSMLTAEVAARSGFDFLCLDRQHGLIDDATLWQQMAAIGRIGKACPWVRVPWNTMADAMRALDGGAAGIIAPMVGNRDEAEALVRACRYPPLGERSWGPVRAGMDDGVGYTKAANDTLFVAAMIETKDGYENLEEIAATPGLDALFVGPNALTRIADIAKANGKLAGIHCSDAAMARACRAWGFRFVTIAADIAFLGQAAAACVQAAQEK